MFCTNVLLLIFHFITATAGTSAAGGTSVAGGTSTTGVEVDPHANYVLIRNAGSEVVTPALWYFSNDDVSTAVV